MTGWVLSSGWGLLVLAVGALVGAFLARLGRVRAGTWGGATLVYSGLVLVWLWNQAQALDTLNSVTDRPLQFSEVTTVVVQLVLDYCGGAALLGVGVLGVEWVLERLLTSDDAHRPPSRPRPATAQLLVPMTLLAVGLTAYLRVLSAHLERASAALRAVAVPPLSPETWPLEIGVLSTGVALVVLGFRRLLFREPRGSTCLPSQQVGRLQAEEELGSR